MDRALTATIGDTLYRLTNLDRREYSISEYKTGQYPKRPIYFLVDGKERLDRDLAAREEFRDFLRVKGIPIPTRFKPWR